MFANKVSTGPWTSPPISYLIAALLAASMLASAHSEDKKNAAQQTYVAPTDPGLYVGSDTCKTCHEEIYTHFATTAHFATTMDSKLDSQKGVEWHGCEACHGPGKEHVDGGGD